MRKSVKELVFLTDKKNEGVFKTYGEAKKVAKEIFDSYAKQRVGMKLPDGKEIKAFYPDEILKTPGVLSNIYGYTGVLSLVNRMGVKLAKAEIEELSANAKKELADIKATFNEPKNFILEAEEIVRSKINAFLNLQKEKMQAEALALKQKAEDEALKQAEQLEALKSGAGEYDEITRKAMIEAIEAKQNKLIDATAKASEINQSSTNSVVRNVWNFKVVDLSKVPAEFLQINSVAVREAIKSGVRSIDGLEIFQECQVAIK